MRPTPHRPGSAPHPWQLLSRVGLSLAIPGWCARDRRWHLASALFLSGVVLPAVTVAYTLGCGRSWVAISLDAGFLAWFALVGAVAVASRLVAVAEVWWHAGRPTPASPQDWVSVAVVVAVLAPAGLGVAAVARARAAIAPSFAGSTDTPLYAADTVDGPAVTTTTEVLPDADAVELDASGPRLWDGHAEILADDDVDQPVAPPPATKPERPRSGVDPAALADVTTVLLLGGDAGPGRSGLRTDTMMLFSIHRPSGRASLVSLPRDTKRILFPPGSALERQYPNGFTEIANAVYPIVSSRQGLRDAYGDVDGVAPGVVATAQAIGYSLDVRIDDYVLVDMQGFLDLVDALGGVTVDVPKQVPMPGNVPGARTQYPDHIGPGVVHMDGSTALGYVRSRKADSDYQRTGRQRALLAALATQIDVRDVALHFPQVAAAIGGTLRTSLTPDELADTLAVIGGETAIVESVGLVPPLIDPSGPDWTKAAQVVGQVQLALVTGQPSGY